MRRDNAMAVAGRWTLRYGYADVFGRPCQVVAQVASVLRACGWTGVARNCGRNCAL
jgi:hypothetical protein